MYTPSTRKRAFLLSVCLPPIVLVLGTGAGCPVGPSDGIGTEQFGLDLANTTSSEVDPGVAVDGFVLELGTLAPLEGNDVPVPFDVECLPGDTLTIDPILLLPVSLGGQVLTDNGPIVLVEGVDYACGDIVGLRFRQDPSGTFFVDPFVNNVSITPPLGLDLVNNTSFEVDPGAAVDDFLLELGTLAPLEGSDVPVSFDGDCLAGDRLTIDPVLLLAPDTRVLAANAPVVLEEGFDYLCGDIIRLEFRQDETEAFFVDVFVDEVLITP